MHCALVPESNPGQRQAAQTIDFGGYTWQLDESAPAKPGTGLNIACRGALTPEIAEGLRLRVGASLDARL